VSPKLYKVTVSLDTEDRGPVPAYAVFRAPSAAQAYRKFAALADDVETCTCGIRHVGLFVGHRFVEPLPARLRRRARACRTRLVLRLEVPR
jgi:hypothetical protein